MSLLQKIIIGFVALGVLGALFVWFFIYNKPHTDFERARPDFTMDAAELYEAFVNDTRAAEEKFNGRVLLLNGEVTLVEETSDMVIVVIAFSEGLFGEEGIRCTMLENHAEAALALQAGQEISIQGFCAGFTGSDVIMEHCSFP